MPTNALQHDPTGAAARQPDQAPFDVIIHRLYNPEGITSYNIVPGLLAIILSMPLVMMTAMAVTREVEGARWKACSRRPPLPSR